SSFFIGLLSIVAQIIIPYAAVMAGPANRGKVTGRMLGGLLTGILLSRTISGFIASPMTFKVTGGATIVLQDILDQIMKGLLPLAAVMAIYFFM
ncbi:PTS system mannose/fructose/sorbose family transporter subunit IID, partial [Enterococcus faecalis]|uniref:PTS system mannose/fructose/sorbose family transporter subunit IID n=1 Tax=Enterococcus faecalis TaxID=1351 RepID=UPI0019D213AE